jgi:hypothetical protein
VEKILDHKTEDGISFYLVKWQDLSANLNSWVKHSDFNATGKIADYHKKRLKDTKQRDLEEDSVIAPTHTIFDAPQRVTKRKESSSDQTGQQRFKFNKQASQKKKTLIPAKIKAISLDNALGPYWHTADSRR